MRYTKGEWEVMGVSIVTSVRTANSRYLAPVAKIEALSQVEREANARLIAAAPDMYEALKELRDSIKEEFGLATAQLDGYIKANKALAKAEGC
jgi:hypothetical protein